jgi:hypothetical protein
MFHLLYQSDTSDFIDVRKIIGLKRTKSMGMKSQIVIDLRKVFKGNQLTSVVVFFITVSSFTSELLITYFFETGHLIKFALFLL